MILAGISSVVNNGNIMETTPQNSLLECLSASKRMTLESLDTYVLADDAALRRVVTKSELRQLDGRLEAVLNIIVADPVKMQNAPAIIMNNISHWSDNRHPSLEAISGRHYIISVDGINSLNYEKQRVDITFTGYLVEKYKDDYEIVGAPYNSSLWVSLEWLESNYPQHVQLLSYHSGNLK